MITSRDLGWSSRFGSRLTSRVLAQPSSSTVPLLWHVVSSWHLGCCYCAQQTGMYMHRLEATVLFCRDCLREKGDIYTPGVRPVRPYGNAPVRPVGDAHTPR